MKTILLVQRSLRGFTNCPQKAGCTIEANVPEVVGRHPVEPFPIDDTSLGPSAIVIWEAFWNPSIIRGIPGYTVVSSKVERIEDVPLDKIHRDGNRYDKLQKDRDDPKDRILMPKNYIKR